VTLVESYYYIEVNHVSGVDLVKISNANNPISNLPMQTSVSVLKGKIFEKIEKIIKAPRFHARGKVLEGIPRSHFHKHAVIPRLLLYKAQDTRNIMAFHLGCLAEIRKLFQYHTGQILPMCTGGHTSLTTNQN
jgi:hypothetical protein